MYLQFIVVCLYIMRPRPRGALYSVCVPSLAPPGEARHHLLELPGILLRQLRHHLADLVLDARVARRRAPPRQHLRRQYSDLFPDVVTGSPVHGTVHLGLDEGLVLELLVRDEVGGGAGHGVEHAVDPLHHRVQQPRLLLRGRGRGRPPLLRGRGAAPLRGRDTARPWLGDLHGGAGRAALLRGRGRGRHAHPPVVWPGLPGVCWSGLVPSLVPRGLLQLLGAGGGVPVDDGQPGVLLSPGQRGGGAEGSQGEHHGNTSHGGWLLVAGVAAGPGQYLYTGHWTLDTGHTTLVSSASGHHWYPAR